MAYGRFGMFKDQTESPTKVRIGNHGADMDLGITIDSTSTSGGSTTLPKGLIMGIITGTNKYVPYDDDGTDDGRRVAKGVLADEIDMTRNSSDGKTAVDQIGVIIRHGAVDASACTGLDANGQADLALIDWR
jgi:hypothetical protein